MGNPSIDYRCNCLFSISLFSSHQVLVFLFLQSTSWQLQMQAKLTNLSMYSRNPSGSSASSPCQVSTATATATLDQTIQETIPSQQHSPTHSSTSPPPAVTTSARWKEAVDHANSNVEAGDGAKASVVPKVHLHATSE